jgi:hypothetical protein
MGRWEDLRTALVGSARARDAANQFQRARSDEEALAPFDHIAALVDYLSIDGEEADDLDDKDQIYRVLVRAVQARAPWAGCAHVLLWCGMWPALHGIYVRRVRNFREAPDELVEGISVAFTAVVADLDLARVSRVFATLKRSTERELMGAWRRERIALDRRGASPGPGRSSGPSHEDADPWDRPELDGSQALDFATPPGRARGRDDPDLPEPVPIEQLPSPEVASFDSALAALRARLLRLPGLDTDLLLAVLVLEEDQATVAARLGLSHDATRKRFQRALVRARSYRVNLLSIIRL